MFINLLRKNLGTIIASFGFVLLCILTFGDLGEFMTDAYWKNVTENITSIGFMSISLTLIQVVVKQGVAEQALQKGLNSLGTTEKYKEHREIIRRNGERGIFLPYFLQVYNKRHTKIKKQEYLTNNDMISEKALYETKRKRLIRGYESIIVSINASRLKWSTTDVMYNKKGQIITLQEYRSKRIAKGVVMSLIFMIGVTFLTRGLFFSPSDEPLWQKFVKLATYIISITISSVFDVTKEYEKGAFGVPNDLDEINAIWAEFEAWTIPRWVIDETNKINEEVNDEQKEVASNGRADIQKEQETSENLHRLESDCSVSIVGGVPRVLRTDDEEFCGECNRDTSTTGQGDIQRDTNQRELSVLSQ